MGENGGKGGEWLMFEFYKSLNIYLSTKLTLYAPIAMSGLDSAPNSISIYSMPTPSGERFYDDERPRQVMFQILTKHKEQTMAMNTLEDIANALERCSFNVAGYQMESCEVYAEPAYLEKTEKNEYIFTAAFNAVIRKTGGEI